MNQHLVKIKSLRHINHDVLQIVTERPQPYNYTPGQATEISINKIDWKDKKRPFTFTSLPDNDYLEFTVKTYPSHNDVTNRFLQLKDDDELILHDVFGAIAYRDEGVFIAGGAGVTPFISIFRYLRSRNNIGNNKLIFANKTKADIILEQEFRNILGKNFINILSDEKSDEYTHGLITESFLKNHINSTTRNVYLCGPPLMMDSIGKILSKIHINEKIIIKETF